MAIAGLPDFWASDFATGTAEQLDVAFADGSTASLDADSAIAVDFTDKTRRIKLLRGRAYFDVAKDMQRPFVVEAASGVTTALGTRFAVHEWDGTVTIAVEESAVSVVAPNRSTVRIGVGQNVSYGEDGMGAIGGVDLASEMAWRRGKLIFEDKPLRQVVADVNRYRKGTIKVTDRRLNDLRISGIFDIRDPEGVLDAIAAALPVRLTRLTDYLILVRPA
ncbi:FecR family protein [Ensifer adhaerens]|uniref:FecR family protein n=1 Tax=Ensifer adhaerens TaxID=106592 RepID=UPI003CFF0833